MENKGLYLVAVIVMFLGYSGFCQNKNYPVINEITQNNPGLTKFPFTVRESNSIVKDLPQLFTLNKQGLFMQPDGTGRLYRIDTSENELKILRIDSTVFFGATFGSYLFSYNDSIYSLGGYGYWKFNGQLRVFIPQKGEWELERLNREITVSRYSSLPLPI